METVAGMDLRVEGDRAVASVVVVDYWTQQVDTSLVVACPADYFGEGLLQQVGILAHALEKVTRAPGAVLLRGSGMEDLTADLLGLLFDLPTVACCPPSDWPEPDTARGSRRSCLVADRPEGAVLRTRDAVAPLLIVPGHRADLESSIDLVLGLCQARVPEPLRAARTAANLLAEQEVTPGKDKEAP